MRELINATLKFIDAGDYRSALDCIINLHRENREVGARLLAAFRVALQRELKAEHNVEQNYELLHQSYILTAPYVFDDFMIALEWYRPNREKFWLPRREQLKGVCDALQALEDDELDELFISMPPRVGKTTIVMFFIIWVMCRDPERSNLYCSYTEAVVKTYFNGIMEVLNDPDTYDLKGIFPDFKIASTDAKDLLINLKRKRRYASLTARSLYGTLNGACDVQGYVVADDLHSGIEEALNKDLMVKAWGRVENNLLPRAKEKAKRLWIGTRWSVVDCIARRIDLVTNDERLKDIRYKIFNLPALNEKDRTNFGYMYNLGFSTRTYHQRMASFERNGDMASWNAQYMGQPVEREGVLINPDELRYYNGQLPEGLDPDRIWMAVDPAWGGGDYTAAPIIYQYGDDLFVADVVYDNGDKTKTQPALAQKIIQHNVQAVYVEATRVTAAYAEGIQAILDREGVRVNMQTTTKHWAGGSGKEQRIFDKTPEIREHCIFLNVAKRDKAYSQFMQNVFAFSITSKNPHDDALDSLTIAVTMAFYREARAVLMARPF